MTVAPQEDALIQIESQNVDNHPWMTGYHWDQSKINKFYKVEYSHSYISPYEQRDHSWNEDEFDMSSEKKWDTETKRPTGYLYLIHI